MTLQFNEILRLRIEEQFPRALNAEEQNGDTNLLQFVDRGELFRRLQEHTGIEVRAISSYFSLIDLDF